MNPVFRPLRELGDAVRERRVSPVALAETFLERLERLVSKYRTPILLVLVYLLLRMLFIIFSNR